MRSYALDTLRGLAILLMVFSGAIPFEGALPAWMYHAQCPPPTHTFNPDLAGITWVDLVFPFFIFSMGAAIPFAIGSKREKGLSKAQISKKIFERGLWLVLFAYLSANFHPWNIQAQSGLDWMICLLAFAGIFLLYGDFPFAFGKRTGIVLKLTGSLLLLVLFCFLTASNRITPACDQYDIIIMVLANIAVTGSLLYLFSEGKKGILFLTWLGIGTCYLFSGIVHVEWISWQADLSFFSGVLDVGYQKYLLILIPGIFAGTEIIKFMSSGQDKNRKGSFSLHVAAILPLISVIVMVWGFYSRNLIAGLILVVFLLSSNYFFLNRQAKNFRRLLIIFQTTGLVLVMLGFFTDPLQNGIKKDPATLSYFLATAGAAFLVLIPIITLVDWLGKKKWISLITRSGQNPMIAYLAGSNLIIPVLTISQVSRLFDLSIHRVFFDMLEAVIITILVAGVSSFFTNRKIYWKS